MRGVIPTERLSCRCGAVEVWSADAGCNPRAGDRSAEHAHAVDRCAREISGILIGLAVRLRRLMGNPLGGPLEHLLPNNASMHLTRNSV